MEWIVFKTNLKKPESKIAFNKLSKKNQEIIKQWCFEKSIISKSEKRQANRERAIIKFLSVLKKDYDKMTYEDYVNISSAISKSKTGIKQSNGDRNFITRFIKDNYENWDKRFKELELLKLEIEGEDKKLKPEDLLTDLEIDKMMKATSDMKTKCLVGVLSVSASRPEELVKLKWNDVDFKNNIIYLYSVKTKKKRYISIDSIVNHLKRLKEETGANDDDLIFPSVSNKQLTIAGLNFKIQELAKKVGIKKRVWAYLFRHTRLSFLITKLSSKVYEEVSGHSLQMGMKTYAHLSKDIILKEMKEKVFDIEDLTEDEKKAFEKRIISLEKDKTTHKVKIETLNKKIDLQNKMYAVSLQKIMPTIRKKILEDLNEGNIIFDKKSNKFIFNQKYDF